MTSQSFLQMLKLTSLPESRFWGESNDYFEGILLISNEDAKRWKGLLVRMGELEDVQWVLVLNVLKLYLYSFLMARKAEKKQQKESSES